MMFETKRGYKQELALIAMNVEMRVISEMMNSWRVIEMIHWRIQFNRRIFESLSIAPELLKPEPFTHGYYRWGTLSTESLLRMPSGMIE